MKELSIEEKAKRYDEAIERAKLSRAQLLDIGEEATEIEHIFPELKESEDEKIRKAIHIYLDWLDGRKDYAPKGEYSIRDMIAWLEKQGEKTIPEDINEAALQYVDTCAVDGEITHDNVTEPYWNNHSMMNAYKAGWLEKQSTSQVRTGLEWVNTIDDACDKRYSEEYAHGEYCHEQSFKWGFQEGVDWREKQGEQKSADKVKPKFKVGDKVNRNDREDEEYNILTITSVNIDEHCYTCHQDSVIDFEEQDLWHIVVEQRPADKVEPRFKVGDWIVYNRNDSSREILYVYDIRDGRYYFNDNIHFSWSTKECDEKCHLWTIQDAKDGDVLKEDSCTFIIERTKPDGTALVHCCLFDDNDFDLIGSTLSFDVDSTYPATEEQRDTLFAKMKKAGYEWDAEEKELRKIEQKPMWSEEDEVRLTSTIQKLEYAKSLDAYNEYGKDSIIKNIDWLKSLKERIRRTNQ